MAKPKARQCAFCGKPMGCFAFAAKVLAHYGGEAGNGYAHPQCFQRAKNKIPIQ
jgi:hypothetical protein